MKRKELKEYHLIKRQNRKKEHVRYAPVSNVTNTFTCRSYGRIGIQVQALHHAGEQTDIDWCHH